MGDEIETEQRREIAALEAENAELRRLKAAVEDDAWALSIGGNCRDGCSMCRTRRDGIGDYRAALLARAKGRA